MEPNRKQDEFETDANPNTRTIRVIERIHFAISFFTFSYDEMRESESRRAHWYMFVQVGLCRLAG